MKNFEKLIAIAMLIFAIGFNLWLYRLEPTAKIDPNDNTFQYALVDRTNQIWDFASNNCPKNLSFVICHLSFLVDHWVPNWAEGYNLPFYYSHIPQILIVGSYRVLRSPLALLQGATLQSVFPLFQYYHWIIYLLFSFFPLSVFLALRVIRLSWLTAGIGALLATQISTDGLYGLDPSSFLWRGYGLSSQLFAMMFLPLAIAFSFKYFSGGKLAPAVFFLFATAAGHLGIGIIAILSLIPLALTNFKKLFILASVTIFFLSYWVIPIVLNDNYHNISFWDPVWKFNSYGAKETIVRLFNGDLFDFGRFPVITLFVLTGLFASLWPKKQASTLYPIPYTLYPFSLLFLFWLLLYFGRTTWGGLFDLVPGMKEFHLSRFLVGVHASGMFLAPIGAGWILGKIRNSVIKIIMFIIIITVIAVPVYQQTIRYNDLNNKLILQANENFDKVKADVDELFTTFRSLPPGRVYAGRGGWWGKNFRVAETTYFMHLSTYGIPTVLWLPETWSPNSDTEQYFREDQKIDYDLYNIRYVATPPDQATQPFWKLIKETNSWKLYEVKTSGYFTAGVRPAIVATDKRSYVNVVRQWIQSDKTHAKGLYPELTFAKDYPKLTGLPNFKMLDEVTYKVPDESLHNLFQEPPVYLAQSANRPKILGPEENIYDMIFKTKVEVPKDCLECIIILKQSYHPNWQATIDGKTVKTINVFPFYVAVLVPQGSHDIVFSYQPSKLKIALVILEGIVLIFWGLTNSKKGIIVNI